MRFVATGVMSICLSSLLFAAEQGDPPITSIFDSLPLCFIENQGRMNEEVSFAHHGADQALFFTSRGVTFSVDGSTQEKSERWTLKLDFVDAQPVVPRGLEPQPTRFSYFRGKPDDWRTDVSAFGKLIYEDLWPGIDLVYSGSVQQLKYEFVVHPGADPDRIRLLYRGVNSVRVNDQGALCIHTPATRLEDGIPYAYQMIDGEEMTVPMAYAGIEQEAEEAFSYGFDLGAYDPQQPLILDPLLLVYSGYIGGGYDEDGDDYVRCITVDDEGHAFVAGHTTCPENHFPVVVGPDLTFNNSPWSQFDAFVAKVNAAGTHLDYCGYIGGGANDFIFGIAVDDLGCAHVAGYAQSSESQGFPVTVGPDLTYNGGHTDVFVAKVAASGTGLEYCGYIGGGSSDYAYGLALDSAGSAYVTGITQSTEADFPVTTGPDLTYNGGDEDAFVAKVNSAGTALEYCGYIGGNDGEEANGIAVDEAGRAYVTGSTESSETSGFPVLVGPDLTFCGGQTEAYVARVNATGTALDYCGYIGGGQNEGGAALALDSQNNVYLIGSTNSDESRFPVLTGPDLTYNGGSSDAFVAKVTASGTGLDYCGYIGGTEEDYGRGVGVDAYGRCYVTGKTDSSKTEGFPTLIGPDLSYNGGDDGFVARIDAMGQRLDYCGYIGGYEGDSPDALALDRFNNVYIVGRTYSPENSFPVVVGPDLVSHGIVWWTGDGFITKLAWALASDAETLPVSTGSQISFALTAGPDHAHRTYVILGSRSGSNPGIPLPGGGTTLPINWDPFTNFVINKLNSNLFHNFLGVLDQYGRATAGLNTGPLKPGSIGDIATFAFCLEGSPDWDFASNPVAIEFVP